ncbi:MAG TPA: hypothetical protein VNA87_00495 [Actinomycetota bacterium]|nr:hypothetical protein [Actinomycetota bacterium]
MTVRPRFLAVIALVVVLALASPARANIEVTLDISGSSGGPTIDQGAPQTPARTGFDPLPLGGIAVLLIAVGFLGLAKQKRADEGGSP